MFKYYIDWRSSKRIKSPTPVKLLHWLKIFNEGSNPPPQVNYDTDWRSSIKDQIPTLGKLLHWLKIFKRAKKQILENEFSKTLQHSQIAKPFPVVLNTMSSHVETVICTGMPRFWPFVKMWYITFRANGGSWPYPYILSPAIWFFSKLGIQLLKFINLDM